MSKSEIKRLITNIRNSGFGHTGMVKYWEAKLKQM